MDERHALIAVDAYDIFINDVDQLGYDVSDPDDCELGAAEAIAQAAYERGVELSAGEEAELVDVLVKRLKTDGVIARRRRASRKRRASLGTWR